MKFLDRIKMWIKDGESYLWELNKILCNMIIAIVQVAIVFQLAIGRLSIQRLIE